MRRVVNTGVTVLVVLAVGLGAWLLFAPAGAGGGLRYAVVDGVSMEPGLSRGDLVLIRPAADPEIGDVVLYYDPAMDARVLHRVVRFDGDRLVLQGDANDFVDDPHPLPADVIGSYWFAIPRAGSALVWLRQPVHAALLAFVLTLVALAGAAPRREEPGELEAP
jgi:signal peptidase I